MNTILHSNMMNTDDQLAALGGRQVEWIAPHIQNSIGDVWLQTSFTPLLSTDNFELDIGMPTALEVSQVSSIKGIVFGVENDNNTNAIAATWFKVTEIFFKAFHPGDAPNHNEPNRKDGGYRMTLKYNGCKMRFIVDGVEYASDNTQPDYATTSIPITKPIWFYRRNSSKTDVMNIPLRLYSFKYWRDGNLAMDIVPCVVTNAKLGYSNIAMAYDKAQKMLLEPYGSGRFDYAEI